MILDCRGQSCPVPVIELARALPTVEIGELIELLSDDPAARHDIPAWCRMRAQDYVGEREHAVGAGYLVRRRS